MRPLDSGPMPPWPLAPLVVDEHVIDLRDEYDDAHADRFVMLWAERIALLVIGMALGGAFA